MQRFTDVRTLTQRVKGTFCKTFLTFRKSNCIFFGGADLRRRMGCQAHQGTKSPGIHGIRSPIFKPGI